MNAQVDQRLSDILGKMCSDLDMLFKYLDSIGKYLDDHYDYARYLCKDVQQQRH